MASGSWPVRFLRRTGVGFCTSTSTKSRPYASRPRLRLPFFYWRPLFIYTSPASHRLAIWKSGRIARDETRTRSDLSPVVRILAVITLSCWILSTAAFYLDRYRVPLIRAAVALLLGFTSLVGNSDSFYDSHKLDKTADKNLLRPSEFSS